MYCVNHPHTETNLSCGKCGDPICVRCVIQTPVGIRCRKCAQLRTLPTFDVATPVMTKAILVGVGMAFLVGFVWSFIRFAGVMPIVIVGLLIGEVISQAVNRKRGTTLQFIAGGSTILALFIFMLFPALTYVGSAFLGGIIGIDGVIGVLLSSFFNALPSLFFNIFGLITIALGIYFSIYKFR